MYDQPPDSPPPFPFSTRLFPGTFFFFFAPKRRTVMIAVRTRRRCLLPSYVQASGLCVNDSFKLCETSLPFSEKSSSSFSVSPRPWAYALVSWLFLTTLPPTSSFLFIPFSATPPFCHTPRHEYGGKNLTCYVVWPHLLYRIWGISTFHGTDFDYVILTSMPSSFGETIQLLPLPPFPTVLLPIAQIQCLDVPKSADFHFPLAPPFLDQSFFIVFLPSS